MALVIGNDSYQNVTSLENARSDARAIAASLQQAGFAVTLKLDANRNAMLEAVRNFKNQVSGGDVAVFYYSGHGVQLGAANYLLPVDIRGDSEDQVRDDALPLQRLLDDLQDQKTKFSLAIIDACRDNPFKVAGKRSIGGTRGLASTTAATGQMVLFSAGAGQQALDRVGPNDRSSNGLFTRVLLAEMDKAGVPVDRVMRNVREQVVAAAKTVNHEQVPALYDQSLGDFYFHPGDASAAMSAPAAPPAQVAMGNSATQRYTPPPAPSPIVAAPDDPDASLWKAVESGNSADDYKAYLQQYPKGKYAVLAKQRLQKFQDQAAAEARATEDAVWQAAEGGGTEAGYQSYLTSYPRGRYAVLAAPRMAKLRADSAAREESDLWARAQSGSTSAVQAYLSRYPTGRYAEAAQGRLDQLKREEAELPPGKVFRDCIECADMVVIPAGSFQMGSDKQDDEKPVHTVTIAKPFAIGRTEVTQAQWAAIMGKNPSTFSQCGDTCPVERVSWDAAQEFIRKLNEKTGKQYRLPSEAEWEYACLAGSRTTYCGSENLDSVAWYPANSNFMTHSAAGKQANAWGLFDMSGNVWEWVQDWYHSDYNGAPNDGSAWETRGAQPLRVMRGGSWFMIPNDLRAAYRSMGHPVVRIHYIGFRLARTLP